MKLNFRVKDTTYLSPINCDTTYESSINYITLISLTIIERLCKRNPIESSINP